MTRNLVTGLQLLVVAVPLWACRGDSAPSDSDYRARHPSWRRARVLVTDRNAASASVIDVEDEEVTATVSLPATAVELVASDTGDHAIVSTAAGVTAVTSGVAVWHHIDHLHIYKFPPKIAPRELGPGVPKAIAANAKAIALTWPDGRADAVSEAALLGSASDDTAHNGSWSDADLAIPITGGTIVLHRKKPSQPATVEFWRKGVREGVSLGTCVEPGPFAAVLSHVAIACSDGVVFVSLSDEVNVPTFLKLIGASLPISWLGLHSDHRRVAAAQGQRRVAILPTVAGAQPFSIVSSVNICAWSLDPGSGAELIGLAEDGSLRVFDITSGNERGRVKVAHPHSCLDVARPRFALAPERAYITDGDRGQVLDVDLRGPRLFQRFSVGGSPARITVLALDVRNINLAPGGENEMVGNWWGDGGADADAPRPIFDGGGD